MQREGQGKKEPVYRPQSSRNQGVYSVVKKVNMLKSIAYLSCNYSVIKMEQVRDDIEHICSTNCNYLFFPVKVGVFLFMFSQETFPVVFYYWTCPSDNCEMLLY